ncbi:hypothetical protein VFPPC_16658 [Pochonia chlamydosporia 170]|uniref:Uncharacterized protein n=1 Tax=Pochonia chlamydosporia 170 TaxID=1380566 RepID=A0A179FAV9_METCM|nr:hypothetical protein VFPPC_16658 [Pochonia chlamydosporia 170]OAQ62440.1 hypothetical protein VFPPC_16658 [Pochonia chlamydosporia 170]
MSRLWFSCHHIVNQGDVAATASIQTAMTNWQNPRVIPQTKSTGPTMEQNPEN